MKRRWLVIGGIAVLVAAGFGWRAANAPPPPPPFKTTTATRGELTEIITANGVINPVQVVNVGTQVSGTVRALHADFNDKVTQGQVLLSLDPVLFEAALAQSEAALANARANADLAAANARRGALLVDKAFISKQSLDGLQAQARAAAATVQQAAARVKQDRANLNFSVIKSPVAGVVISRQVDVGQTVAASFNTPTLFQIARDLTEMQIETSVAEADIGKVRPGEAVTFTVDAHPGRTFTGTVREIRLNPTTQQNVVTYTVIVKAANKDGALLPGMTANASFIVSNVKDALLVPNAALSFKPADWKPQRSSHRGAAPLLDTVTIFVEKAGKAEPRKVTIGASDADMTVVTGGPLAVGDHVITASNNDAAKSGGLFGPPPGAPGGPGNRNGSGRGDSKQ
ncbi:MAG: efflux RND transporter periplasmic adaptor subunit [Sphingomonadales bacterium]|jgi:HlyD family secretion protein